MSAVVLAVSGFITSRSSLGADLSLITEVLAVVLLTIGVFYAVRHDYARHRGFQTAGVIVSIIPAVLWMIPSLWKNTLPDFPGNLDDASQVLTVVHSAVAVAAVILGLVLVIRGNQRMAAGADMSGYKPAMRVAYVLYVAAAVLGVVLYVRIYG
jgi:uncharacterized membrane protein YozB (DUF420 family)